MQENQNLETKPEQTTTIYPHSALPIIKIAKAWTIIAATTTTILILSNNTIKDKELQKLITFGCAALCAGGVLFAAHQFLHYSNTFLQINNEALIHRTGWIPNKINTIFWINIKDINTQASVLESMLNSGTITLLVAIRTEIETVKIPFLPNHEKIADFIRKKISSLNKDARNISYT